MSVFTDAEREYLTEQRLARIATASAKATPDVSAVTFVLADDTIEIRGRDNPATLKWRNVVANPRASVVIDDLATIEPWVPRGIKIRGRAETIQRDGTTGVIVVHADTIWSWGINQGADTYFAGMIEKRVVNS